MRIFLKGILVLVLVFSYQTGFSQTLDEYIKKAEKFNQADDLEQAATVMEEAIQKYPDNSTAYSYLGLYRGAQAGTTENYMEAGRLVEVGYDMLNKAVALDPNNPIARLNRGILSVNVPPFFGKLDEGIQDLETLVKIYDKSPEKVPTGMLTSAYNFLAQGYQKKEDTQKAIVAWKKVIELAPNSDQSKNAEKNIASLTQPQQQESMPEQKYSASDVQVLKQKADQTPNDPMLLIKLGHAYYDTKEYDKADQVLRKAIKLDSTNIDAYKWLIRTTEQLAGKGYDERIYNDTDFRSKLAFEITNLTEKAVALAPNDPELRVMRGSIGVMMPFFVGKLDQAMEDLNWVAKSDAPKDIKAQALYWLGYAYQKKATTQWIKVITDYKNTEASHLAFENMRPAIQHFDPQKHQRPFLEIDFVLGFRDELAPQSAVWIEDKNGNFVKTVYVSGFSGYAKEKQANLSDWADASKFRDTDAVTAASIDVGHHVYVWNLKDYQGKSVKAGEYVVKIEVAYWPSMEYQSTKANFTIAKKDSRVVVEEGDLVPYLMVKYYSE
jgi:tetratricopeptide (TPR) repeat protein